MGNRKVDLSLYLMVAGTTQDECFANRGQLEAYGLKDSSLTGTLFVKEAQARTPHWLTFLSEIAEGLQAASVARPTSAVLVLQVASAQQERLVCYAFGHGHQLLDKRRVENRFGLVAALNAIDAEQLRSVDTLRRADTLFNAHVQTSSAAQLADFQVDTYREMLTRVAGSVRDKYTLQLGSVLRGAANARFSVSVDAEGLAQRAELLLDLHRGDAYREWFGFIDQHAAADQAMCGRLDAELAEEIKRRANGEAGDFAYLDLAAPRVLDPDKSHGFEYTSDASGPRDDLRLSDYLATRSGEIAVSGLACLEDDMVLLRSADGEDAELGSVFGCLVGEVELGERLYQLVGGTWYALHKSLVETVRNELDQVEESDIDFPAYRAGEQEADYNGRAADELGAALMDRISPGIAEHPNRVEFCDFALADESAAAPFVLVFAKRRKGSSTLSHLWSQAVVSLESYLGDDEYRGRVRAELARSGTGLRRAADGPVRPQDYCVTFLVLGARASDRVWKTLPFFSQAALHYALRELRALQVRVRLASAPIADAAVGTGSAGGR